MHFKWKLSLTQRLYRIEGFIILIKTVVQTKLLYCYNSSHLIQSVKLYFLQEVDGVKILQLETAAGAAIRVLSPPFSLIYEVHAVHTTNFHAMCTKLYSNHCLIYWSFILYIQMQLCMSTVDVCWIILIAMFTVIICLSPCYQSHKLRELNFSPHHGLGQAL